MHWQSRSHATTHDMARRGRRKRSGHKSTRWPSGPASRWSRHSARGTGIKIKSKTFYTRKHAERRLASQAGTRQRPDQEKDRQGARPGEKANARGRSTPRQETQSKKAAARGHPRAAHNTRQTHRERKGVNREIRSSPLPYTPWVERSKDKRQTRHNQRQHINITGQVSTASPSSGSMQPSTRAVK